MAVYLNGEKAEEASALRRAAEMLGQARLPVIGGLLTDIAGVEAALALAMKLGGVIDHEAGEALARGSRIMREAGGAPASLGEARNRADIIVVLGERLLRHDADIVADLFPAKAGLPRPGDNPRELVLLGGSKVKLRDVPITSIPLGKHDLPTLIATLAALVAGRRLRGKAKDVDARLVGVAERLRGAAFPVFVYSLSDLDEPVLHAVLDLVRHLSLTTRAATLALAMPGNGDGVDLCSAWTCGLPVPTSFTGATPKHDWWMYSAKRLIESGEGDALLWIDALEAQGSKPPRGAPTVLLASHKRVGKAAADVAIEVGCAGRDHDAALYLSPISGIGMVKAAEPSTTKPSVAETLNRITGLLADGEARSC